LIVILHFLSSRRATRQHDAQWQVVVLNTRVTGLPADPLELAHDVAEDLGGMRQRERLSSSADRDEEPRRGGALVARIRSRGYETGTIT
jgi:hypothetical protein